MAQINSCLKRVFIAFNLLFAILGGVLIGLAVLSQAFISNDDASVQVETRTTGLIFLYVIGAGTMLIALLGAYGAYREHKVSLIVFLVLMIIGALLMIRAGIPSAIVRPQLEEVLEEKFRELLPLNFAPPEVKQLADKLQTQLHCCGLFSYRDWNNQFPESCWCQQSEEDQCTQVDDLRNLFLSYNAESKSVYSKPCFPIIKHYILLGANIIIGFFFTLASLAVLGMILSSIMIHQLRHPNRPTVLLSVPAIFTPSLPKYQELQNPPPPMYEVLQSPPPKYEELQSPPPPTPVY